MTTTLDIIKQILDSELSMPTGRVWAYNADYPLPQDKDLFIVLSIAYRQPYGNNVKYVGSVENLQEIKSMEVAEDIIISLMSKDTSARDRAWEAQLALGSTYSQELQDKNKMHISKLGEVFDASFLEASSRLNRFDIRCRVIRGYEKTKNISYYDKFNIELWEEQNGSVTKIDVKKDYT